MLVRVGDAAVMLFFEGVFGGIRVGIAALPKLLDELLAFFVGLKVEEGATLFRGDDVNDVLVQPLLVLGVEFFVEIFVALGPLFGGLFGSFFVGWIRLLSLGFTLRRDAWCIEQNAS